MKATGFATALLVATSCQSPQPQGDAAPEPSVRPTAARANVSDQRVKPHSTSSQVLPGLSGETDGREVDAGIGFREEAKKGCTDIKCTGDNCARLCAKWMNDNSPSSASGDVRNKAYFGCLGTCLMETDQ